MKFTNTMGGKIRMDRLRRYEMLVKAADAGSFAKAAALLELDPSAVSHAIGQLERQLRTTLFYRTTRQLRLTSDGEQLCARAREILQQVAELENASRAPRKLTGTLRIGMNVPMSRNVVMPRLPEFTRRHPDLAIECLVLARVKDMEASGVDVMVSAGEAPRPQLIARKVMTLRFGVYAAPAYLEDAGIPPGPDDLRRHRCLVHKPPFALKPLDRWEFERAGERRHVEVPRSLVTDDREGLIAAAVAGAGLMRLGMFDPGLIAAGRLRRVLGDWDCVGTLPVYALYRRSSRVAPKVTAFLQFLGEAAAAFDPQDVTVIHEPKFAESLLHSRD
jgi:LysR family transcriptional regulator for bpeEF and oprC